MKNLPEKLLLTLLALGLLLTSAVEATDNATAKQPHSTPLNITQN